MSEQNLMDSPAEQFSGDGGFEGDFDGNDNSGEQPSPGMGQSKSSRRRRRKRKGKGPETAGEAAGGSDGDGGGASGGAAAFVMEGESIAAAATTPSTPPQARRQQQNGGQQGGGQPQGGQQAGGQQQAGQGGKRWKKKFRDRDRRGPRNENPGNDFRADNTQGSQSNGGGGQNNGYRADNFSNGGGGFKRKNKGGGSNGGGQRRERGGFIGPMDHSYREADGNSAGASTIQLHGSGRRTGHRHHGDSQPIDHSMPRAIPIPENAQTHIYFFIEELFFQAKIQESAKKLGVKVAFLKADNKEALAELTGGGNVDKPALIVFDLNNANAKPLTLIPKLKTKLKRSASIIGFLSHLQGDLKAKAVEAGCDTVMPRSAFSQNLPNLLRRYGVEEVEEINYNY
jgi:CheY-like chemotaxis protein